MSDQIFDVLQRAIAQQTGVAAETITPASNLADLGVKSLDLVEIIMSIEDHFDISVPDNAVDAWDRYKTVADLVQLGEQLGLVRGTHGS
jgi:acyl carrier protein